MVWWPMRNSDQHDDVPRFAYKEMAICHFAKCEICAEGKSSDTKPSEQADHPESNIGLPLAFAMDSLEHGPK